MSFQSDNIALTIYCMTYNHENYIEKTLQGFMSQQTNFRFKVIVHDDASKDNTAEIIRKYTEKYPDVILPIFQSENKYSKHIPLFDNYIKPELEGRYIAVCEGDDYWCYPSKLQMQYDYMEAHPECALCVHNTKKINSDEKETGELFNKNNKDTDYFTEDVILAGGGGLFHTSSFFLRKESRLAMPDAFKIKGVGDYPLSIWLSIVGKHVHYIGRVMSAYRVNTPFSWSVKIHSSKEKILSSLDNIIDGIKQMDQYTEFKYHKPFCKRMDFLEYNKIVVNRRWSRIVLNPKYWGLFLFSMIKKLCKIFGYQTD